MVTPDSGRDDERGTDSAHILTTTAAVTAAVLALTVALAILLGPNARPSGGAAAHSPTTTATRATLRARPPAQALRPPAPQTAVAPVPVREIGGDCSAGGITAHWDLRDGQWACVPRDEHRIGADCSHDGVTAQWNITPERRWICVPGEQGDAQPPTATPGGL